MSNSDEATAAKIGPCEAPVPIDRCGMAVAARMLMAKWTMLIVREAFYGVARFEDFLQDLDIPRSVLTTRLKQLVSDDILVRVPYQPEGARLRHGYVLTRKGHELGLVILALMQWGDQHVFDGKSAIRVTEKATKKDLKVALVPAEDPTPGLAEIEIVILDR